MTECYRCGREAELSPRSRCLTCEYESNQFNEKENELVREQYHDLVMQVESKYPDETRHATAKRYIREMERRTHRASKRGNPDLSVGLEINNDNVLDNRTEKEKLVATMKKIALANTMSLTVSDNEKDS